MARTRFRFLYTWVFTVNPKGLSPKQHISYFQVCATKRSPDVRTPDVHHVEQYNVDACYYTWWSASSLDRRREPWTTCLSRCCFMTMSSATAVCEPHKRNFEASLLLNFSCKTLLPNFHILIEILFSYVLVCFSMIYSMIVRLACTGCFKSSFRFFIRSNFPNYFKNLFLKT